jgi:hypothetical protein
MGSHEPSRKPEDEAALSSKKPHNVRSGKLTGESRIRSRLESLGSKPPAL